MRLLLLLFIIINSLILASPIRIFLIGDSTMSSYDTTNSYPIRGWGQQFPLFFSSEIEIYNHAASGRSTKSFIDEGKWNKVLSNLNQGDYVFIQFAHNDEKSDTLRHTDPWTTFSANLIRFINDTRSKNAIPILLAPIVRRKFYNDSLVNTHGDYPAAMRKVALDLNVNLIDMNLLTHDLVQSYGVEESKKLYVHLLPGENSYFPDGKSDNTHTSELGATLFAGLVCDELIKQNHELSKYLITVNVDNKTSVINDYKLLQNYPNPFNLSTTIEYQLPEVGLTTIKIYNSLGQIVSELVNEEKSVGKYQINFNASNLSSGIYFYELKVNQFRKVNKMLLVK